MIPYKDFLSLRKLINQIINRGTILSGWKELYWALWGKSSSLGNRFFYFRQLPLRDQKILTLRYGLKRGDPPRTLEETGEVMGITRERVRQLESRALLRLRAIYRKTYNKYSKTKKGLKEFEPEQVTPAMNYVLEEIRTFDSNLIKYFGTEGFKDYMIKLQKALHDQDKSRKNNTH